MSQLLQRLFVGSNNTTGVLEKDLIVGVVNQRYPMGSTNYPTEGCWRGGSEKSLCIEVAGMDTPISRKDFEIMARIICIACQQECVMVQRFVREGFSYELVRAE